MWSKVLGAAVMPLNVALGAALLALLLRARRRGRLALVVGALGLLQLVAASLPVVARACARGLEAAWPPVAPGALPAADAIVVLGGAVGPAPVAGAGPELTEAADRVLHAARAFRAGKAPLVVATGGGESGGARPEADDIADLLVEWGVPREAIVVDRAARTTRENATGVRAALAGRPVRRVLLVTSALHMARAAACFRAEGFEVLPAPTDYLAPPAVSPRWTDWVPDAGALETTSAVVHEVVGAWWYRLRGWCE